MSQTIWREQGGTGLEAVPCQGLPGQAPDQDGGSPPEGPPHHLLWAAQGPVQVGCGGAKAAHCQVPRPENTPPVQPNTIHQFTQALQPALPLPSGASSAPSRELAQESGAIPRLVGKKGSTRGMDQFPLSTPELVDFDRWLASPCGKGRAQSVRKEALKYLHPERLNWECLLDEIGLIRYERELEERDVGVDGRLGKLERLGEAHRYLRFLLRAAKPPDMEARLAQLGSVESSLEPWKTKLREKRKALANQRLETLSNSDRLEYGKVQDILDSRTLRDGFHSAVRCVQRGGIPTPDVRCGSRLSVRAAGKQLPARGYHKDDTSRVRERS